LVAEPPLVKLALACEAAPTHALLSALLASASDEMRSQALAFMEQPRAARERDRRLVWMRADSARRVPALLTYYAAHIADFIDDWGQTFDPRLVDKLIPFRLFPKQREMVDAMVVAYRNKEALSIVKSRDSGASWCCMAVLASLCIFEPGFTSIIGSQLEIKIDAGGNTNTLFHKLRMFLDYLPEEFRGGWTLKSGSKSMLVWFPNGSRLAAAVAPPA
jgi:phage terminase large subunit